MKTRSLLLIARRKESEEKRKTRFYRRGIETIFEVVLLVAIGAVAAFIFAACLFGLMDNVFDFLKDKLIDSLEEVFEKAIEKLLEVI